MGVEVGAGTGGKARLGSGVAVATVLGKAEGIDRGVEVGLGEADCDGEGLS